MTGRVRWLAGPDGTAHCRVGNAPRTLCGLPAIVERYAWPPTSRCLVCRSVMAMPPGAICRPPRGGRPLVELLPCDAETGDPESAA